jgi:hypothetical protein
MAFNILTAKGGNMRFICPFRLTVIPDPDSKEKNPTKPLYKAYLNWHSALYDNMVPTETLGKKYLNFKKITIRNLNFSEELGEELYKEKYIYCVLKIPIDNFTVKPPAEIVFVPQSEPEDLVPIAFESEENLKQIEARIIVAVIAYDDKAVAETEFAFDKKSGSRNISDSVYVIQCVQSNLIMTNMVFNGVPVLYPAPFGGAYTSTDGSDREL